MKLHILNLFIFLAVLNGCNKKENIPVKQSFELPVETDFKFNGFPVYNISEDVDAVTFELNEYDKADPFYPIYSDVEKEDTLYSFDTQLKPVNSTLIDTSGVFNILKSEKLQQRIKAKLKPSYYVYGTKGFTSVKLGEVYFTIHECYSNIVAVKILGYDRAKFGRPLICTEQPITGFIYGNKYKDAEKSIERFLKTNEAVTDYRNPPGTSIVFANVGSYYFAYEDDFSRKRDDSDNLSFPGRYIYHVNNNGKTVMIWGKSLDLFGIPCD